MSYVKPYVHNVVMEFYINLLRSVSDMNNKLHQKVFVRGEWYEFNPAMIIKVLNCYRQNMVELMRPWTKLQRP